MPDKKRAMMRYALSGLGIICMVLTAAAATIAELLPKENELGQTVTAGYRQTAAGEKLVELINGGAVLYFKHGFEQAVFQEYYHDSTQYINLEIYQMLSREGATGVFRARTDTSAQKIPIGDSGFHDTYFCTFHRDEYYVIVTGSDSTEAIQQLLFKAAELVDRKIRADR